jgi:hypothetical protein
MTEDQHRKISILASMSKDGAAEMNPEDDARKVFLILLELVQCSVKLPRID